MSPITPIGPARHNRKRVAQRATVDSPLLPSRRAPAPPTLAEPMVCPSRGTPLSTLTPAMIEQYDFRPAAMRDCLEKLNGNGLRQLARSGARKTATDTPTAVITPRVERVVDNDDAVSSSTIDDEAEAASAAEVENADLRASIFALDDIE